MFTVDNYKVWFDHNFKTFSLKSGHKSRETTLVAIENLETKEVLGQFWVVRYYKDQNNRDKARKFSLDKALGILFPGKENKELRTRFWKAYFEKIQSDKEKSFEHLHTKNLGEN